MATTYVDTSALVKRYVAGVGSAWERQPLRAYDAVQLACALTVRRLMYQRGLPPPLFIAADERCNSVHRHL